MMTTTHEETTVERDPMPGHPRFQKIVKKIRELKDRADEVKTEHDDLVKEAKAILQDIYGDSCSIGGDGYNVTMYSSNGDRLNMKQFKEALLSHITADVFEECKAGATKHGVTSNLRVEYAKKDGADEQNSEG